MYTSSHNFDIILIHSFNILFHQVQSTKGVSTMLLEWVSIHSEDESRENPQNDIKETYLEDFDTAVYEKIIPQMYEHNSELVDNFDELEEQLFWAKKDENIPQVPNDISANHRPLLCPELPNLLLDITYFRIITKIHDYVEHPHISNSNYDFPTFDQILEIINLTKEVIYNGKAAIFSLRTRDESFEQSFEYYYELINSDLHSRNNYELHRFPEKEIASISNPEVRELLFQLNNVITGNDYPSLKKRKINNLLYKISVAYNGSAQAYTIVKKYSQSNPHILTPVNGPISYNKSRQSIYLSICKQHTTEITNTIISNIQMIFTMATRVAASYTPNELLLNYHSLADDLKKLISEYYSSLSTRSNPEGDIIKRCLKFKKGSSKKCIALICFPNEPDRNMFSISGTEFKEEKGIITRNESYDVLAKELKNELNTLGSFEFCMQNFIVRRFNRYVPGGKPPETLTGPSTFKKLRDYTSWKTNYQYMFENINWLQEGRNYSCCERKFLARLEGDNLNRPRIPYPDHIEIFITFDKPCKMCVPALEYYSCISPSPRKVFCNYKRYK